MRDGKPFVFEAVQPVKLTPLDDWIARGERGQFVVKRLRDADERLTAEALREDARRPASSSPAGTTTRTSNGRTTVSTAPSSSGRCSSAERNRSSASCRRSRHSDLVASGRPSESQGAVRRSRAAPDEVVISPAAIFDAPDLGNGVSALSGARTSKRQDRLNHRHPAGQARRVRSKGSAVGRFVHSHQLAAEPHALGVEEVPLDAGRRTPTSRRTRRRPPEPRPYTANFLGTTK